MRVGLLWRVEWDPPDAHVAITESCKLREMFRAFAALGVDSVPVIYSDETVDAVRDQLLGLDGVLVWVNPIQQGLDRSKLDPLLREVGEAGVWVSAHPDVILRMGTKEVLVDTASMSWGTETKLYRTTEELGDELPERLAEQGPLVLKQHRGMGGNGVWKVESDGPASVRVQHATKGSVPSGCRWRSSSPLRAVLCRNRADGRAAVPGAPGGGDDPRLPDPRRGGRLRPPVPARAPATRGRRPRPRVEDVRASAEPAYGALRDRLESEWVPEMQAILGLDTDALPAIWDADFLHGPKTATETTPTCSARSTSARPSPFQSSPCRRSQRRPSNGSRSEREYTPSPKSSVRQRAGMSPDALAPSRVPRRKRGGPLVLRLVLLVVLAFLVVLALLAMIIFTSGRATSCLGAHFPGPTSTAEPPSVAPIFHPVNPVAGAKPDEKLANSLACGSCVWPVAKPTSLPLANTPVNLAVDLFPRGDVDAELAVDHTDVVCRVADNPRLERDRPGKVPVSRRDTAVAGLGRHQGLTVGGRAARRLADRKHAVAAMKVPVTDLMLFVASKPFGHRQPSRREHHKHNR